MAEGKGAPREFESLPDWDSRAWTWTSKTMVNPRFISQVRPYSNTPEFTVVHQFEICSGNRNCEIPLTLGRCSDSVVPCLSDQESARRISTSLRSWLSILQPETRKTQRIIRRKIRRRSRSAGLGALREGKHALGALRQNSAVPSLKRPLKRDTVKSADCPEWRGPGKMIFRHSYRWDSIRWTLRDYVASALHVSPTHLRGCASWTA